MSDAPTVAITGAAGYIGSRVVTILQERRPEWEIVALDNFYVGDIREIGDVTVQYVDIRNRDRLEETLAGADLVIHLAAISGVDDCTENADLAHEGNVTGTANVAWFCRKTGAGLLFPFSMGSLGDPTDFPITVDQPREPMHWYGRTKVAGERVIDSYADGAFPAHLYMKSNLYGDHEVGGQAVFKGTVINFFVDRALSGKSLTVYEPGTQARNYIHVKDIARVYLRGAEQILDRLDRGETGTEKFEIASDEDPSVMRVAEMVQAIASEEADVDVDIELVENPRAGDETLVDEFGVDTSRANEILGWEPEYTVEESIRELIRSRAD